MGFVQGVGYILATTRRFCPGGGLSGRVLFGVLSGVWGTVWGGRVWGSVRGVLSAGFVRLPCMVLLTFSRFGRAFVSETGSALLSWHLDYMDMLFRDVGS